MAWKKAQAANYLDFIDKIEAFTTKTAYAGAVTPDAGNTGTGIVYGASATDSSVTETWTLICTTAGGNGVAIFSVTGSVSGPQVPATAAVPYSVSNVSFTILGGSVDYVIGDEFAFDVTDTLAATTPAAGASNTGDGTIGAVTPMSGALDEAWTLTCTADGPGAVFSVTGSVSGAKAGLTSEVAYDNGIFIMMVEDGLTAWVSGDVITFSISGDREYETKRGNATGGNLSNDYLKSMQWGELGGHTNLRQTTQGLVAGSWEGTSIPVPMTTINNTNFTISMDVFKSSSYVNPAFMLVINTSVSNETGTIMFLAGGGEILGVTIGNYSIRHVGEVSLNQWHNLIYTYNRASSEFVLYIDGVIVASGISGGVSNVLQTMRVGGVAFTTYGPQYNMLGGLKNIQIYTSILSGGDIATIAGGGVVSGVAHHWPCSEGPGVRYARDIAGGTAYDMDVGPVKKELILKGKGDAGTSEIYTGVQSYSDAVSKFNLALQGFTGYVGSNPFSGQPGAMTTARGMLLQNTAFDFFIHTTPNRIILLADSGGNDESAYLGWYIPYFSQDQWGYPMAIGGSATDATSMSSGSVASTHKAWFHLSDALMMLISGAWTQTPTSDPISINSFNATSHIAATDGTYPDFDFIPFSINQGGVSGNNIMFGPFEGVTIPVRAEAVNPGDVLTTLDKARLIMGDTFRTGLGSSYPVAAIDLSGD